MEIQRYTRIDLLYDNEEFLINFDNELKTHLQNTIMNKKEYYRALKFLYNKNIKSFKDFTDKYSNDGIYKIWNNTNFIFKDLETKLKYMIIPFKGKKRPKHSEMMKIKMLGIDRGDNFRKIKNEQNKSINFKKKFLQNKNINIENKTDEEVYNIYCEYISKRNKSEEFRINKIKKFLKNDKYKNEELYEYFKNKYLNIKLDNKNYEEIYSEMLSLISIIAIKNNGNMGKTNYFKKGLINTKYCLNKSIISFRSSWEEKTIQFLEENKIKYEYEPIYLVTDNHRYYLPDFILPDLKIMLEIKGFIRGKEGEKNEEFKIKAAKRYCEKKGLKFIYLKNILTNLKQLN